MAITALTNDVRVGIVTGIWADVPNGNTGAPFDYARFSDKTVQVWGTFGSGGSITLQGSNDPRVITDAGNAVWFTLTDPQGDAITKTSAGGCSVVENPRFIRPTVTAGDGTTSLTIAICARGAAY